MHQYPPVISSNKSPGRSRNEKYEEQEIALVRIDQWLVRFPAMLFCVFFNDRLVDTRPFFRRSDERRVTNNNK